MARGRPRKHKEKRTSATYYLPKKLIAQVKKAAKDKGVQVSELVLQALTKEVD